MEWSPGMTIMLASPWTAVRHSPPTGSHTLSPRFVSTLSVTTAGLSEMVYDTSTLRVPCSWTDWTLESAASSGTETSAPIIVSIVVFI